MSVIFGEVLTVLYILNFSKSKRKMERASRAMEESKNIIINFFFRKWPKTLFNDDNFAQKHLQFEKYKAFFSFFFHSLRNSPFSSLFLTVCCTIQSLSLNNLIEEEPDWSHSQSAHQEFPQPFVKILSLEKNKCSRSQFETAIWTVQVRTFLFYSHGNWGSFSFLTSGYAFRLTINLWVFLNFEKWLLGWQEMKCPCISVLWFIDSLVASLIVVIWYVF